MECKCGPRWCLIIAKIRLGLYWNVPNEAAVGRKSWTFAPPPRTRYKFGRGQKYMQKSKITYFASRATHTTRGRREKKKRGAAGVCALFFLFFPREKAREKKIGRLRRGPSDNWRGGWWLAHSWRRSSLASLPTWEISATIRDDAAHPARGGCCRGTGNSKGFSQSAARARWGRDRARGRSAGAGAERELWKSLLEIFNLGLGTRGGVIEPGFWVACGVRGLLLGLRFRGSFGCGKMSSVNYFLGGRVNLFGGWRYYYFYCLRFLGLWFFG